jgi:hypothetical protein
MEVVVRGPRGEKVTESSWCDRATVEGVSVVGRKDGRIVFTYVLQPGDMVQEDGRDLIVQQRRDSPSAVSHVVLSAAPGCGDKPSGQMARKGTGLSLRTLLALAVLGFILYQALLAR